MESMNLFYTKPANRWEEALPIGNGSLGAMIYGGAVDERLSLNEDTLWSGYAHDKNNPTASAFLEQARALIMSGRYSEGEKLIEEQMLGEYNESYLPLGDLLVHFGHPEAVTEYKRTLDIENAVAAVSYTAGGCKYTREYFASYPARAIFIRLTCDQPKMNLSVSFDSQLRHEAVYAENSINIKGKCPEHVDPNYVERPVSIIQGEKGMTFDAQMNILYSDGSVKAKEDALQIANASEVILAFSAVKPAAFDPKMDYASLKALHIEDYRAIYNKVELYLGEQPNLPTDERVVRLRNGEKDNGLFALYFQFGRYLLISSSRAGSQASNLQGIWNGELRAPWSSNWTTNINVQMNYWAAQSCNLQECLQPYFELCERLCENGKKTAKVHYNCRGFVHHHNADYWCSTNPVGLVHGEQTAEEGSATWSFWPMGGAWLTAELYKHYEYNPDKEFLKKTAYPILREAALFLIDWVYEHDGQYITCPSTSPENRFITEEGKTCCAAVSSAMDLALIREVFTNFEKTCAELNIDDEILPNIKERLAKLTPFGIGSKGQMLEWHKEFEEREPGHRHISHLYGLFPSELFAGDHRLTEACRISLEERLKNGSGQTGWSCAWISNVFAILEDRDNVYRYLTRLLTVGTQNFPWSDNMPYQLDANFGGTSAIANMLVQDRNGEVKLLPALPREFESGYVRGLRIKNGKSVDIKWHNGKLEESRVY